MITRLKLTVRTTSVHVGQVLLHLGGREHRNVLEAERREYVALEVLIQGLLGSTFDAKASPVDVNLSHASTEIGSKWRFLHTPYCQPSPG